MSNRLTTQFLGNYTSYVSNNDCPTKLYEANKNNTLV